MKTNSALDILVCPRYLLSEDDKQYQQLTLECPGGGGQMDPIGFSGNLNVLNLIAKPQLHEIEICILRAMLDFIYFFSEGLTFKTKLFGTNVLCGAL